MAGFGIGHEADAACPWSDFVIDSVRLLNKQLEPEKLRFFFDEVNVTQKIIDGHKVWNMYGWAVSESESSEFEEMWLADADGNAGVDGATLTDIFSDAPVSWEGRNGNPFAHIVHYDGWDDPGTVFGV